VTKEILDEYSEVLRRPQFSFLSKDEIGPVLHRLSQGFFVRPERTLTVSPDAADNRFLECAEAASADYLVTGNKRHFPSSWKKTHVVSPRELVDIVFLQK
jgi:uncharacterized protein